MTAERVNELDHGLYVLVWKDGGESVASVGSNVHGERWFAPTNWIRVPWFDWSKVESAKLIHVVPASELLGLPAQT